MYPGLYLFSVPVIVMIAIKEIGTGKLRGFAKIIAFFFCLINFVYFQILITCISVVYSIITIIYPPINPIRIITVMMDPDFGNNDEEDD